MQTVINLLAEIRKREHYNLDRMPHVVHSIINVWLHVNEAYVTYVFM